MPEGNPLVAQSKQDGSGLFVEGNSDYGWVGGTNLTESGMDAFRGIASGDWVSGGLGVLSLAAEVASAAVDPFGYLMSSVASFLMEHVKPLKDMLDSIAGNPPVIQSYADTWGNVSKALGERKTDFDNAVKNGTTGWTGAGADAYRKFAAEHSDALSAAASVAGGISTAVMIMGQVVAFVRQMVRQLISDLVGKLISWVMEEVFSLGFGTPVVVAQASAAIAKWGKKIGDLLKKLTDTIRKISPLLSKLVDIFEKIAKVFGKVLGKVTGLDGIKLKETGFVHHLPKEKGGVHARAHADGGGGEGGHHGEGDSSPGEGSHGSDGESSHSGDGESSHGGDGEGSHSGDGDAGSTRGDSDSPSSDPMNTDGRSGSGDSDSSGSRRTSGRDEGGSSGNSPGEDGSPSSLRSDDGAPARAGESSPSPAHSSDGGTPSHANSGSDNLGSAPSPSHSSPSARASEGGSPAPTRSGDGGAPSHTGDSGPAPTHAGNDGGGTPAHTGDSTPAPARSAAPSHTDGGSPAPTHSGSSSPGGRSDAPSSHTGSGTETPSSAAPPRTDGSTSASGTAPTAPRTGDPGPAGVSPSRGGDGAAQPGIPPQGGAPMAGGALPPGGAAGGGLGGSPGRAGAGGSGGTTWTGTPGSPGGHGTHTPEPSARPGRGSADPRTRTPGGEPAPAARGGYGTPAPAGHPSARPGGPEHFGPGGTHGPGDGTPGHGPRDHDGSPTHHDPDGGHHGPEGEPERLTPDEVNAQYAESTRSGSSYHAHDADMGNLPHLVHPDPAGRYTVDVHVTPDGHARIGDKLYTPEEFADILRRNGDYDGRPIRLIGCDAGSNDFAHRLSRELDTEVMAPTKPAWTDSRGRVFSSEYEIGPDGRMRPRIPPDGEWHTHHPDGTTHRASDDGFTPDTHESQKHDLDADSAVDRGQRPYDQAERDQDVRDLRQENRDRREEGLDAVRHHDNGNVNPTTDDLRRPHERALTTARFRDGNGNVEDLYSFSGKEHDWAPAKDGPTYPKHERLFGTKDAGTYRPELGVPDPNTKFGRVHDSEPKLLEEVVRRNFAERSGLDRAEVDDIIKKEIEKSRRAEAAGSVEYRDSLKGETARARDRMDGALEEINRRGAERAQARGETYTPLTRESIEGDMRMVVDLPSAKRDHIPPEYQICDSCTDVILQYKRLFPNVRVEVVNLAGERLM